MRNQVDASKVHTLLRELGRRARGPGKIYLTGGASALLEGWRGTTVDVDLKLDPEPAGVFEAGVFEAIAGLKNELAINIELSAPDQFLPSPPDWRERSPFIARYGEIDFYHYDFRAQALAKVARGHERDVADVHAMLRRDLVTVGDLRSVFEQIKPRLIRYPSIDVPTLEAKVERLLAAWSSQS